MRKSLVVAVMLGSVAAPAPAAARLHSVAADAAGAWVTDGGRYAIYRRDVGHVRVLDGRTGRTASVATDCTPAFLRAATAVVTCPVGPNVEPRLLSLTSGRVSTIVGLAPGDQAGGIGRRWISVGGPYDQAVINRETGERVSRPFEDYRPRDLDARDPRPLGPRELPTLHHGRFWTRFRPPVVLHGPNGFRRTLCSRSCGRPWLTGGFLLWTQLRRPSGVGTAHAFTLRTHRVTAWRIPGDSGRDPLEPGVAASEGARRVLLSQKWGPDSYRLYWAPRPS